MAKKEAPAKTAEKVQSTEEYTLETEKTTAPPSRKKRILKIAAIVLLLLLLIVGGFVVGIYLRIFDTNEVNEKMGLYNLPIIGQYFVKPVPKNSKDDIASTPASLVEDTKPTEDKKTSKPVVLTKAEIDKQTKEREAEERKRLSKLARLYNEMKPEEAADIIDALDDNTAIAILKKMDEGQSAQIMTKLDPSKAARFTKIIYNGTDSKPKQTSPSGQQQTDSDMMQTGQGTDTAF